MIRDGRQAFVGSQSLGRIELDDRRELGVIVSEARVVREMQSIFEHDWKLTQGGRNYRGSIPSLRVLSARIP